MAKQKGKELGDGKPEEETGGSKGKEETKAEPPGPPPIGLIELFKFSTPLDAFLIIFGLSMALACGSSMPILCILFGDTLQSFVADASAEAVKAQIGGNETDWEPAGSGVFATLTRFGYSMITLAFCLWTVSWIFVTCLNLAAARQVFRIRCEFLRNVLRQDISWYDRNTATDFASRMTEDLNKLQEGIGEKLGMLTFYSGTFLFSMVIAFAYGWDLTLVILSMLPLMSVFGALAAKVQTSFAQKEMEAYGQAGVIAEEVLSAVRTVVAFGGEKKEVARYEEKLEGARSKGVQRGMLTGLGGGLSFGTMFAMYGLGFWYGIKCIMDDREGEACQSCDLNSKDYLVCAEECQRYTPGALLTVFFSVLIGGFQIGQSAPYAEALNIARSVAGRIYKVIERDPDIDSSSKTGKVPGKMVGNIRFRDVSFSYPSRPDVPILKGFDLEVPSGKTVALVGASGSGKSTCIQLVQRFYDPASGTVEVDEENVKDLNIGWLRDNIGVVGQEPVLFDLSIRENIMLGSSMSTEEDIERACKDANAINFIKNLPQGLDTMVGEGGTQLSGGQKQRIAIARALLRRPKILLLDEATSALDTASEKVVQEALDKARTGRTTLVVAHRLSTIKSADIIVAVEEGRVKETGSHEELMAMEGLYHSLVMRQVQGKVSDESSLSNAIYPKLGHDSTDTGEKSFKDGTLTPQGKGNEKNKSDQEKDSKSDQPKIEIGRLLRRNSPEALYIVIGSLASIFVAAIMPIYAVLFGRVLGVLAYTDIEQARSDSIYYALLLLLLGFGSALSQFLQGWMFGLSGENLTKRLRRDAFEAMLKQEMGWHDKQENNTGALCARLSGDAGKVQGATGSRVGNVLQAIFAMLIAVLISVAHEWRLGLVGAVLFPVMVVSVVLGQKVSHGVDSVERDAFEKSAKLAIEAISNIRTVAGLRCEAKYVEMFTKLLEEPHKRTIRRSHLRGFIFGFSQGSQFIMYSAIMWYGGYLVQIGATNFSTVFTVAEAIMAGAWMMGNAFAFTGDFSKALEAAGRVFELLDRKPKIDANHNVGLKLNQVEGKLRIRDGEFCYPTRRDIQVLNRLNLSIKTGEKVALVGESGCGKSTVIQIIQRLYDLDKGCLDLQGTNIEALNLPYVRSKLGIVSQEPVLFDRSIKENIEYGDNEREVGMEEVISAARKANIHEFVAALPEGYETRVGAKGCQLSGGQKQRVAIARVLVRNPKILLLDEATSALDMESEKMVQEALDEAQMGRTSITIAHRLTTIAGADQIYVIEKGEIVECGTHDELINKRAIYAKLWNSSAH